MTTLPVLDVAAAPPPVLLAALRRHGALLATDPSVAADRCAAALRDAADLFALADADKAAFAIERSRHFRGHGRMHNERDYREQVHFGREREPVAGVEPFWRLRGPNLWPADTAWRERCVAHLDAVEQVGIRLLAKVAAALGLDHRPWLGTDPYVLGKYIGYHAQPGAGGTPRRGVAAHLDFSLVTLTLQDDVGGLETRRPDGRWLPVPAGSGVLLVVVGELLQFVTGDRLVATPHRVVNPSATRMRCSIPVFVNPSLDTVLRRGPGSVPLRATDGEHVHAVLDAAAMPVSLHFGAAEWARKGENVWCARCVGDQARRGGETDRRAW